MGVCLLACTGVEFGIQCASGFTFFFFGIFLGGIKLFTLGALQLNAQQGRVLRKGGLLEIHLSKLLLDEVSVGPPHHASPPGRSLGHGQSGLRSWCHSQGIQMSDSLFGPLIGELSRYLHFVSGFLESLLVAYNLYHVAGPRLYARQLVGVME